MEISIKTSYPPPLMNSENSSTEPHRPLNPFVKILFFLLGFFVTWTVLHPSYKKVGTAATASMAITTVQMDGNGNSQTPFAAPGDPTNGVAPLAPGKALLNLVAVMDGKGKWVLKPAAELGLQSENEILEYLREYAMKHSEARRPQPINSEVPYYAVWDYYPLPVSSDAGSF